MIKKMSQGHWPIFLLNSFSSMGKIFLPMVLVRLLTPEEVGQYKIFYLYLMALPFLFMTGGPTHSIFYWVGKNQGERERTLNATWIWTLLLSSLILILGWPLKSLIAAKTGLSEGHVVLMLLAGSLWCPSGHYSESAIAHGRSAKGSLYDTFFELIKTGTFILIAYRWKDLSSIFIFHVLLMFSKLVLGYWLNFRENSVSFRTDKESLIKVWTYFSPVALAGCLGFFVDKLDLLVLSSVLHPATFAIYSMGCLIVPPLFLLETAVQKVLIPHLSRTHTEGNWAEGAKHFRQGVADIAFLIVPSVLGLITFAEPIVKLLYTEEYLSSATYLQVFALSYLLLIFPHDSVARASGKTSWILKMYLFITPLSLITGHFSAKWWGPMGILIAGILLKVIPKILGLQFSRQLMNWSWAEMFPWGKLLPYLTLALTLSLASLVLKGLFKSDMNWFFVCAPAFAVVYLGVFNFRKSIPHGNQDGKTIILFTPGPIGGAEKVVVMGQRALEQKKCNTELWIINEERVPAVMRAFRDFTESAQIRYRSFSSSTIFDFSLLWRLRREFAKARPIILHAHGLKAALYGWLARPAATRLIITHHGRTGHTWKVRLYEWIESMVMKNAHGVIAVSNEMKKDLHQQGILLERLFLVENLLALNLRDRSLCPGDDLRLVFVGRLSPEKGADVLLRALGRCRVRYTLTFVGDGPEREKLGRLASELNIAKKISFAGFQKDVSPYLQGAHALVMPSLKEGQPLALIEACCMGLPVIASDVGGIPGLIEQGQNGLLFPPGDSAQLARELEHFYWSRETIMKCSMQRRDEMQKRFSLNTWAQRTLESYDNVLIQS